MCQLIKSAGTIHYVTPSVSLNDLCTIYNTVPVIGALLNASTPEDIKKVVHFIQGYN